MRECIGKLVPPLLPLVFLSAGLELLCRLGVVKSYIVPAPSEVMISLWQDRFEYLAGIQQTAECAITGLVLSFIFGSVTAILLSLSELARRAFLPYALFFQTVPIIAIAPVLVIWFGFGEPTVIASAFIVSVFPVIASTLLGLQSTEPALVELFKLYHASSWNMLLRLRIPYALPYIFSGLKIATGLAVIGAIVGEFVGGGGVGSIIDVARTQQRLDKVFAAVLISAILGFVLFSLVQLLSSRVLRRWHASERTV